MSNHPIISDFIDHLPHILETIDAADFISVDLEISGEVLFFYSLVVCWLVLITGVTIFVILNIDLHS